MSQQLKKQSSEFKKFFILAFTKELIKNSSKDRFRDYKIKEHKPKIREKIPKREFYNQKEKRKIKVQNLKQQQEEFEKSIKSKKSIKGTPMLPAKRPEKIPVLRIPNERLPSRLQYLRPVSTRKQIELGKLNPLIADPMINVIECNGPDTEVIAKGRIGIKRTGITLDKEEIEEIIKNFSEATKIPIYEGVFRVAFGNLTLSSIISKDIGNKFVIKKIPPLNPAPRKPVPRAYP